jgi:hypothetical protein
MSDEKMPDEEVYDLKSTTPDALRAIALWRHHEAARDKGAMLLALVRCRTQENDPLSDLYDLQRVLIAETLHEFCHHARKAIELADVHVKGIKDRAYKAMIDRDYSALGEGERVSLKAESLMFFLGRVIHSHKLFVLEHEHPRTDRSTRPTWARQVVRLQSDRDEASDHNDVLVAKLIESFCLFEPEIQKALDVAGTVRFVFRRTSFPPPNALRVDDLP